MSLQKYLFGIGISTLLCFIAFFLVMFYVDPYEAGLAGFVAFYVSLFFGLVGLFTLGGFYTRLWMSRNEVVYAHVAPSFRQGILLAVVMIGSMVLQSFRLFTWWAAALFVVCVVLLEFFFMSRQSTSLRRR